MFKNILRYIYIVSKSNKILMDKIYDCTYFKSKRKGKDNKEIVNGSTISLGVDFTRDSIFTHKEKLLGITRQVNKNGKKITKLIIMRKGDAIDIED